MENSNCYDCKYRGGVAGSTHSSCHAEFSKEAPVPQFDAHGIKSGWVIFPWNFDPVWMKSKCSNFNAK